ncbi:hypothetical protein WJX73_007776 [Symbiochloris irregularis]|uniref:Uncharacterized protein n=1 Tax=Symbiochloris irregularis TaxID=706552 RepID=A0AAW1NLD3_9CHLO
MPWLQPHDRATGGLQSHDVPLWDPFLLKVSSGLRRCNSGWGKRGCRNGCGLFHAVYPEAQEAAARRFAQHAAAEQHVRQGFGSAGRVINVVALGAAVIWLGSKCIGTSGAGRS